VSQINPDPHAAGYKYWPTRAVLAFFPPGADVQAVQRDLNSAGFGSDQVHVFQGEAGADRLDLKGERHGDWVQFRRELQRTFTDEPRILDRMEGVLRSGGAVVAAFTDGDATRKAEAARVIKSYGALEAGYWGDWVLESL
jgi:hypothetical protein